MRPNEFATIAPGRQHEPAKQHDTAAGHGPHELTAFELDLVAGGLGPCIIGPPDFDHCQHFVGKR